MFKKIKSLIMRGLLVALSLTFVTPTMCYAANVNDLREYLGLPLIQNDATDENVYYYKGYEQETISYNSEELDEYALGLVGEANRKEMLAEYNGQLDTLFQRLDERFNDRSTAYLITSTVDEIVRLTKAINSIEKANKIATDNFEAGDDYLYTSKVKEKDDSTLQLIRQSVSEVDFNDIARLDYNIGDIGDKAECVVSSYFEIVRPYGFTKHSNEEEYSEAKLEGIELYAREGTAIVSQFNGIVVGLGQDIDCNAEWIKVYSGNGLYTIYEHVHSISGVEIGTKVSQGQKIAEAADTLTYETGKKNHILYRIELNGTLINPLLIYGSRGQSLYERWMTSHAEDNLVEKGEEYFNEVDESYKPKQDNVLDVLFPDFNMED